MTNPGLPPALSKASRDLAGDLAREIKTQLDQLLADVDDALADQAVAAGTELTAA